MKIEFAPGRSIVMEMVAIDVLSMHIDYAEGHHHQGDYNFTLTIDNEVDVEDSIADVIVEVYIRDTFDHSAGQYQARCRFLVGNMEELDWNRPSNQELRKQVAAIWNSIAVSTTRGMMHGDFKGTYLHHAVLPLVDPADYTTEAAMAGL